MTEGSAVIVPIAVGGTPMPDVSWARNDVRIVSNGRRMVSSSGLRFSQVKESDAGRYTVWVKNSAGSSSISFTLKVHIPPAFTHEPSLTYPIRDGDQLRLSCSASGNPRPSITWSFDGSAEITPFIRTTPGLSTLSIPNVRAGHGGLYTCTATNTVGSEASVTTVTVETPPMIKSRVNTTVSSRVGKTVTFDCHADGDPQPLYTWTHNQVKVEQSAHYSLTVNGTLSIFNVSAEDSGEIRCTAHNPGFL